MKINISGRMSLLLSAVFLIVPVIIYAVWLWAIEQGNDHNERVEIFQQSFPSFLQGRFTTTYLSIVLLAGSVYFSIEAVKYTKGIPKALSFFVLIVGGLLLFLNVFSLM